MCDLGSEGKWAEWGCAGVFKHRGRQGRDERPALALPYKEIREQNSNGTLEECSI